MGVVIGLIAGQARELIMSGFAIPVAPGLNLSPTLTAIKLYAHLTLPGVFPLTPLNLLPGLKNVEFGTMDSFSGRVIDPPRSCTKGVGACYPANSCLMASIGAAYDRRQVNSSTPWFKTTGMDYTPKSSL
jgi:hypothetical protein